MDTPAKDAHKGISPHASLLPTKRGVIVYLTCWFALSMLFFAAVMLVDRKVTLRNEALFNEQQARQTLLICRTIQDHINLLMSECTILSRYTLREYLAGKRDIGQIADIFQAELMAYPDAFCYTLVDGTGELLYARGVETPEGEYAVNLSLMWAKRFLPRFARVQEGPLVPLFSLTSAYPVLGMLFPLWIGEELSGVLIVVMNLKSIAARTIVPLCSGQTGKGFLLDGHGVVLYDRRQGDRFGKDIFEAGAAANKDLKSVHKRMLAASSGKDTYKDPARGKGISRFKDMLAAGRVPRELIAWHSMLLGEQKLIVVLSAPSSEANRSLDAMRLSYALLGMVLVLVLVGMSAYHFHSRN